MEVLLGVGSLRAIGVQLPADILLQPSLDNNWRFLGIVWAGYAALLLYAVNDPLRHTTLLRILLGILFLSGAVRASSVVLTGWPVPQFIVAMVFELVVMPLMAWWLGRLVTTHKQSKPW
jgi:predicted Na+-dependent transporter